MDLLIGDTTSTKLSAEDDGQTTRMRSLQGNSDRRGIRTTLQPRAPVRFGLIGCGRIGRVHATNMALSIPDAKLVALAGRRMEHAIACAHRCGLASARPHARSILEDPSIHAVILATGAEPHAELIHRAALNSKSVFVEAPLGLEGQKLEVVQQAVDDAGISVQVGFNRRFDPHAIGMQTALRSGRCGKLIQLQIQRSIYVEQNSSCAAIRSLGHQLSHDIDMIHWMSGLEVRHVFALHNESTPSSSHQEKLDKIAVQGALSVSLHLENDVIANIEHRYSGNARCFHRLVAIGTLGQLSCGDPIEQSSALEWQGATDSLEGRSSASADRGLRSREDSEGRSRVRVSRLESPSVWQVPALDQVFSNRLGSSYVAELIAFVEALRGRPAPGAGLVDGLRALHTCRAIERSLSSGKSQELMY